MKYSAGKMPSLKKIVKGELDIDVQVSEHDSVFPPSSRPAIQYTAYAFFVCMEED